jgi:hypothetical protein
MTQWPIVSSRVDSQGLRRFVSQHHSFSYADDVIPLMRRNDPEETYIYVCDGKLDEYIREGYRTRADLAARAATSTSKLIRDVRSVAASLAAARDQPLRLWNVTLVSGVMYVMFELVDEQRIAACMKTMDARFGTALLP